MEGLLGARSRLAPGRRIQASQAAGSPAAGMDFAPKVPVNGEGQGQARWPGGPRRLGEVRRPGGPGLGPGLPGLGGLAISMLTGCPRHAPTPEVPECGG